MITNPNGLVRATVVMALLLVVSGAAKCLAQSPFRMSVESRSQLTSLDYLASMLLIANHEKKGIDLVENQRIAIQDCLNRRLDLLENIQEQARKPETEVSNAEIEKLVTESVAEIRQLYKEAIGVLLPHQKRQLTAIHFRFMVGQYGFGCIAGGVVEASKLSLYADLLDVSADEAKSLGEIHQEAHEAILDLGSRMSSEMRVAGEEFMAAFQKELNEPQKAMLKKCP